MNERKIATFRKDFGEGDSENLEIVLLFVIIIESLGSLSYYSIGYSSLKMLSPFDDHSQNLELSFRKL